MGKQWKQWQTLFSWAPKSPQMVTAAMKLRHLLLGRKAMSNLDNVLKSKDIILLTKVYILKAMVFPVVTYSSESWTIKKADRQRTDAFKLWCWRRLLNSKEIKPVNLKGNQSWIFTGRIDVEAEAPVLWPPNVKSWLVRKNSDAGTIEGRRRRGWQRIRWLDDITNLMARTLRRLWDLVMDWEAWGTAVHVVAKGQIQLNSWTQLKYIIKLKFRHVVLWPQLPLCSTHPPGILLMIPLHTDICVWAKAWLTSIEQLTLPIC